MVPDCTDLFFPIRDTFQELFWPSLLAGSVSESENELFCLPTKLAGMGIRDPVRMTTRAFVSSREGSSKIVGALIDGTPFSVFEHRDAFLRASSSTHAQRLAYGKSQLNRLQESFDYERCRAIERVLAEKNSQWISMLPLAKHHFDLSPLEFRDALAFHYCLHSSEKYPYMLHCLSALYNSKQHP